tara:strand:- start:1419 stop:1661 length:243 start_codon:yes stop_codon:yes gene_type:complete
MHRIEKNILHYANKRKQLRKIKQLKNKIKMEKEIFEYLENLRESGITNMFGAGIFIQEEFGLGKLEAREILVKWIKSKKS